MKKYCLFLKQPSFFFSLVGLWDAVRCLSQLWLQKRRDPCPPGLVCSDILQSEQVQVALYDTLPPVVVASCCHCSVLSVLDFLQHEEICAALFSL